MSDLKYVKQFFKNIDVKNIRFKEHFHLRSFERPISTDLAISLIKNPERLLNVEKQTSRIEGQDKYKIWLKLSNKYNLILIIALSKKLLYIITGWNSDRKWQKSIQK